MVKGLRDKGIKDLRKYLGTHIEVVREAIRSIRVIDVNDATLGLYEAESKEQLLGSLEITLNIDVDPVVREPLTEMICAIDEGRKKIQMESAARTLLGKPLSLIVRSYIPAEDDAFPSMLVSLIDITQRKKAETEVAQLQKRIEFILGATKTGLDIIDAQFNLRYVDPGWQRIYGDPTGKKCYEYFMGAKSACAKCSLPFVFQARSAFLSEEALPKEGNRLVQVTTVPFQDESGEWLAAEINVDITERKRVEERNRQLAALVESADDAIVGIAPDRSISVWNKGAERIYGYTADEILGQSTSLLIPPELEDEARLMREKLVRGERIEHFETVRRRKDGAFIDVSLTLSIIRDAEGKNIGTASIARDITAQKAIQAQLQRAQRLESLATLAGGIAHQFNNINTVVKGYLDMIQEQGNLPDRLSTYAKGATKSIEKAVDITDRLLALTAPTAAELKPVRLETLTRSLLTLLESRFVAEKVALVLQLEETPLVQAAESRLLFVISSLIVNALDALVEQPLRVITIRNGRRPDAVFLEVSDTGCGIPPENLPRLFTPFFTSKGEWAAAGSPEAKLKGVGLSLSVSNVTITEYGGRLEVKSTPGNGSTFRLIMPFVKENA